MSRHYKIKLRTVLSILIMSVIGVTLDVVLERLVKPLGLPVYLDTLGTVLVSMLGGTLPGVLTAIITTLVRSHTLTWMNIYFGVISVFVAVTVGWLKNKGFFGKVWKAAVAVLFIAVMSGVLSAVLTWFVYGYTAGEGVTKVYAEKAAALGIGDTEFKSLLWACLFIDLIDKIVIILSAIGIYHLIPKKLKDILDDPLVNTNYYGSSAKVRFSLLRKIIAVVFIAEVLLGVLACTITYYLYRDASVAKYTEICTGVSKSVTLHIDPDMVDEYIEKGEEAEGYTEIENHLYTLRDSFPEIEYVYVYRIETRGCRVVFDLDNEDEQGADPGDLIPFDDSFEELLPKLRAGEAIDPIITDDTYGWLLTVYTPVYNEKGECVCYSCADITMGSIIIDQAVFISKVFSLYFAVSIIIMSIALELAKSYIVYPINAMAKSAEQFAYDTDAGRSMSMKNLQQLDISTNDEINNLYVSLNRMAADSTRYIHEVKKQAELISKMQEEIILDFAEMVEARDKCTGDHIKKTSYYVEVIAKELRREGRFADTLTDDYIAQLVRSAPLHDVGKIMISDAILNKPGKLTEEEFETMKTHTTAGKEILTKTNGLALSTGYLKEAIDMAYCHHERWDGTGYPSGIRGEAIPLSARIMAVADVFDALVSQRSYKKPFSYEKAVAIIKEESGSHFDPTVVNAFLNVCEEAYYQGR